MIQHPINMKTTNPVSRPAVAIKSVALAVAMGVAVLSGAGPHARAETITIDVNSPDNVEQVSPLSGPAGNTEHWNNLVMSDNWLGVAADNLVDGTGNATSIGISLNFPYRDPWGDPALQMLQSGAYNPGVDDWGQTEINGLTPGGTYDLYIAGSRVNDDTGANGVFHINGQDKTLNNGDPPRNGDTWVEGVNYVLFEGLVADAEGKISFQVCDGPLFVCGLQIVDANVPATIPAAPTGLAAVPGDARVVLSWTASPGATGYNVKRSVGIGSVYTTIATPSSTTCTDAAVVNGTNYHYVVSATNTAGESENSAQVSARPVAPLSSAKDMVTFGPGAVISGNTIVWSVPYGTNAASLAPTFTLSAGATCEPPSGTALNFTTPQTFTVTAEDGSRRHYLVTVVRMINVNFDTSTRAGLDGPAGGAGATWNERLGTAGLTASGLLDASGAGTSVGFTCDASNVDPWGDPALKMLAGAAYSFANSPVSLVINGLNPGKKYALHIASFYPNELGGRSLFSTANTTTTAGVQVADNFGPDGNAVSWDIGVNCVRFDDMVPDSHNKITVTMTPDAATSGKRAFLSGFQLVEDPGAPADPYAEWLAGFDFSGFTNPDLSLSGSPATDGLTNQVKFAYGLDPTVAANFANGLTRERWEDIPGTRVSDLTGNRYRFLVDADERVLVPGVDESGNSDSYGSRYRGFLIAPVTGTYHFWIAGQNEAELWLADGTIKKTIDNQIVHLTNRYGKQRIAWVEDLRFGLNQTAVHEFDKFPSQMSRAVELQAGQKYYFEVLHKQDGGDDNLSVAWQIPNGMREVIPATAFNGDFTQDDDLDDDNLPSAWELANSLNPNDNGLSNPRDGQYGDADMDGLTNLEEYQLDTNPQSADTDGDGLTDKAERDFFHTNPLVHDNLTAATYATLPPQNYASATGHWNRDASGSLTAIERRGEISYNFTVAAGDAGVFEIVLTGGAAGVPRAVENLALVFSINGSRIGAATLTSLNGATASVTILTPWLKPGAYSLTILHDNYRAALQLRIDSLTIRSLGGIDANHNHRPDWIDGRLAAENHFTRIPATSLTSPLCIEGIAAPGVDAQGHTSRIPGLSLISNNSPLVPKVSVDSSFYADVTLSESAPTTVTAKFQSGALSETHTITWLPTNLRAHKTLDIRKGDSLRLDAWNNDGVPGNNATFTVILDGSLLADAQGVTNHHSGQPFTVAFDEAGSHTLVTTYGNKPPHVTKLHVHRANFGPELIARAYFPVAWTPPSLSPKLTVQADSRLSWDETTTGGNPRSFNVMPFEAGERYVLARIPDDVTGATCAIVDRGTVTAFYLAYIDETGDAQLIHTYPDGTRLMSGSIVAVGLPPGVYIRLKNLFQGTVFTDGSDTLWLTAANFDQNGIATIYFEWKGDGNPKMCTYVDIFTTPPPPQDAPANPSPR